MTGSRRTDIERALRHIRKAAEIYKGKNLNDRWIAIGHMAEASESCLPEHGDVAEEIRLERIVMMDDPYHYSPDFKSLITRVSGIK